LDHKFRASALILLLVPLLWCGCVFAAESEPPQVHGGKTKSLQVLKISFRGNKTIASSALKKILSTKEKKFRWFFKAPFDPKVFSEDLKRIPEFYVSQGFYHMRLLSHEVEREGGNNVKIVIRLREGPPMLVGGLVLKIDGPCPGKWRTELLKIIPIKVGKRFTTPDYKDIEKFAGMFLAARGYPKAKLAMRAVLNKATNRGKVTVGIRVGPVCTFGAIRVEGNESVAKRVILRELRFCPGERFDGSKIEAARQRLFALDLFQFIDISVEDLDKKTTALPIRILVKEAKKETLRLGVGYGTQDLFRGLGQYEIRDFLGDGRRLQINLKASSIVQLLEAEFTQPYFLDSTGALVVDGGVMRESEVSFENLKTYLQPRYRYKWFSGLSTYWGYNFEANYLSNVVIPPSSTDQVHQAYFVSSLVSGTTWDRVDSILNPSRGWRVLQYAEWASSVLGSQVDYFKFSLDARGYIPLSKYGTLAGRLKYGAIEPLEGSADVPIFKRFFCGGADDVRGYPYQKLGPLAPDGNPIGGMELLEGSLEYRFPIRMPLEGALFSDFGNVAPEIGSFSFSDTRYTVGVGVRYLTIVGPLRFDVGYELNAPEHVSFAPYQFYFSIGQPF
jgi:outer membrane protein assembly complex protein YaeT